MVNVKEAAPESEEQKFKQKCNELKKRIAEVEQSNEISSLALSRTRTSIRKLRLEYSVLLERLESNLSTITDQTKTDELWEVSQGPSLLDESLSLRQGKASAVKSAKSKHVLKATGSVTKTVKDPQLPAKPTNAYLMFCESVKDRVKTELDAGTLGTPSTDLSQALTDIWSSLSEAERAPYVKMYDDDRDRYYNEMLAYNKNIADGKKNLESIETPEDSTVFQDRANLGEEPNEHELEGGKAVTERSSRTTEGGEVTQSSNPEAISIEGSGRSFLPQADSPDHDNQVKRLKVDDTVSHAPHVQSS